LLLSQLSSPSKQNHKLVQVAKSGRFTQRSHYHRLIEYIILAQVQLSRILGVKKGHNHLSWSNRINRMSADFVVCNKDSSIVAVIELDDSTHEKPDRQAADAKKDKAFEAAEIKIIRWQAKSMPDISTIKSTLLVTKL
jgi:very-short-patch-repair endonuclease